MNHTVTMKQPKRAAALNIRTITMTALLSAMAYVLAFVEFPVPLSPSFARMDLSDFPALMEHLPSDRSLVCSLNLSKTPCSF